MKIPLIFLSLLLTGCSLVTPQPTHAPLQETPTTQPIAADLPNPASVFCEQQGNKLDIRPAADGNQSGICISPDGIECDEWAYYRGECVFPNEGLLIITPTEVMSAEIPTEIPTPMPIESADYQGWWTYSHDVYGFSIMLPEDWIVEEVTGNDSLNNGHVLNLHPSYASGKENIRMTFRRTGENAWLWPDGVGVGEFIPQGTLDIAGLPALRLLLVCPTGEVTEIWYHQAEGQGNIMRGDLEFGFIFSTGGHCEPGISLGGKVQHLGEMIIASLQVP
jgi:putative hemolysin